jgi:hypothetical protein
MYSLTIIGGGAISCGYDTPDSSNIITHIHAALLHPNVELECIVEPDSKKRNIIKKKWLGNYVCFESIEESLKVFNSDLLVIASPTDTHLSIIKKIQKVYKPKVILCEKPTVSNLYQWIELNDLIISQGLKVITNFTRRFDPSINQIAEIFNTEKLKVNHFYGSFPKGLIHNGSHMIDLLSLLIPGKMNIEALSCIRKENDFFGQFKVQIGEVSGFFCNIDVPELSLFELVIYTNLAKIEINNSFIRVHKLSQHPEFQEYKIFGEVDELPLTTNNSAYNSLEASLKVDKDYKFYKSISLQQLDVGNIIYSLKEELGQIYS